MTQEHVTHRLRADRLALARRHCRRWAVAAMPVAGLVALYIECAVILWQRHALLPLTIVAVAGAAGAGVLVVLVIVQWTKAHRAVRRAEAEGVASWE